MADIFRRALFPVAGGAFAGALVALPISRFLSVTDEGISIVTLSASVALMILIGVLAVAGPARRVVRVDATEALREG